MEIEKVNCDSTKKPLFKLNQRPTAACFLNLVSMQVPSAALQSVTSTLQHFAQLPLLLELALIAAVRGRLRRV